MQPEWHSFNNWIDTFIEEKGIDTNHTFEIEKNDTLHLIDIAMIVSFLKSEYFVDENAKAKIKSTFVKIDFLNGDVLDYLKFLAKGII